MAFGLDATPPLAGLSPPSARPLVAGAELQRDLLILARPARARRLGPARPRPADLAPVRRRHGFPLRDQWFVSDVLHSGARYLAWALALVLLVGIWRPLPFARGSGARDRVALGRGDGRLRAADPPAEAGQPDQLPLVAGRVRRQRAPCLALGARPGRRRSGPLLSRRPCHCGVLLPAGLVRPAPSAPVAARRWLIATLVAGAGADVVQVVRGAHYISHSLWTGWFCWPCSAWLLVHAIQRRASGCAERTPEGRATVCRLGSPPARARARPSPRARCRRRCGRAWRRRARRRRSSLVLAPGSSLVGNLALWRSLARDRPAARAACCLGLGVAVLLFAARVGAAVAHRLVPLDEAAVARRPARRRAVAQHYMLSYRIGDGPDHDRQRRRRPTRTRRATC